VPINRVRNPITIDIWPQQSIKIQHLYNKIQQKAPKIKPSRQILNANVENHTHIGVHYIIILKNVKLLKKTAQKRAHMLILLIVVKVQAPI
jgi:hypothetical protein